MVHRYCPIRNFVFHIVSQVMLKKNPLIFNYFSYNISMDINLVTCVKKKQFTKAYI